MLQNHSYLNRKAKRFCSHPSPTHTSIGSWKPAPPANISLALSTRKEIVTASEIQGQVLSWICSELLLELGLWKSDTRRRKAAWVIWRWWEAGGATCGLVFFFCLDRYKKSSTSHANFVDIFVLFWIKAVSILLSELHRCLIRCYWFCSWQTKTNVNNPLTEVRISLKKSYSCHDPGLLLLDMVHQERKMSCNWPWW